MNKIYGFFNSKSFEGDAVGVAITSDGTVVATHISSNESWAKHDLGMDGYSDWKHDIYNELFPDGWTYEFVSIEDQDSHPGLKSAIERNRTK